MTESEARTLATGYLISLRMDSDVDFAIDDDISERHAAGFVFFYNTADYCERVIL